MAKDRVSQKDRKRILKSSDHKAREATRRADAWARNPEGSKYGRVYLTVADGVIERSYLAK